MKRNTIRRVFTVLGLIALGLTVAPGPAFADPHHPFGEELLQQCASQMADLPVDVTLPSASSSTLVPSFQVTGEEFACWSFGWAEIDAPSAPLTVIPEFAGPNITSSGWDCNHSSFFYGIYGQTSIGTWVYLRGGLGYGKLANGQCGHDVNNPPSQASWGDNSQRQWGGGKFRIGVQSWNHNDPNFGHPNPLCGTATNCYWNTLLRILVG
jgi:hypothetical protein